MSKYLFCLVFLSSSAFSSVFDEYQGGEIEMGGVLYHFRELYDHKRGDFGVRNYLKPVFLLSHKGYLAGYFKNSHQRNSYLVGVRRYWPTVHYDAFDLLPGYSFGVVTGYCHGLDYDIYDDCSRGRKWQLAPYGQLFLKFKKGHYSFNVGYSIVLSYLTASYYLS